MGASSARKRKRDMGVKVLFSHSVASKDLEKVVTKLGGSKVDSASACTHFVVDDKFVRSANMLEAIAAGKHVVTQKWLTSSRLARRFVEEDLYTLSDAVKEREHKFSLRQALEEARKRPLLQGKRVYIAAGPSTTPDYKSLAGWVTAAGGEVAESFTSASRHKEDHSLFVISTPDAKDLWTPLARRGAEVYTAELIMSGILKQRLEFDAHGIGKSG